MSAETVTDEAITSKAGAELARFDAPGPVQSWQFMGTTYESAGRFCTAMVKSGLLAARGIDTPAKAFYVVMKGVELGLPPVYALENVHPIESQGRVSLVIEIEALLAIVLRRGVRVRFVTGNDDHTKQTVELTRPDGSKHQETFFKETAERAGLLKKFNWTYDVDMMRWRALGRGIKFFCADLVLSGGGFMTRQEVEDLGEAEVIETVKAEPAKPLTRDAVTSRPGRKPEVVEDVFAASADDPLAGDEKETQGEAKTEETPQPAAKPTAPAGKRHPVLDAAEKAGALRGADEFEVDAEIADWCGLDASGIFTPASFPEDTLVRIVNAYKQRMARKGGK